MPVSGSFFKYITLMQIGDTPAQIKSRSPLAVVREWTEMIKLEHTVFALPFALSGLILAAPELPSFSTVFFTILAFVGARSAAMTLNRLIDSRIDAANPRTKDRAIPAGRIKPGLALVFAVLSFGLMLFAASKLPPICLMLSPIAVFWQLLLFHKTLHLALSHSFGHCPGRSGAGWMGGRGWIHNRYCTLAIGSSCHNLGGRIRYHLRLSRLQF